MKKYKEITIVTTAGEISIVGIHRPDLEKPTWHYFEDNIGCLWHFRKEHLIYICEEIEND